MNSTEVQNPRCSQSCISYVDEQLATCNKVFAVGGSGQHLLICISLVPRHDPGAQAWVCI